MRRISRVSEALSGRGTPQRCVSISPFGQLRCTSAVHKGTLHRARQQHDRGDATYRTDTPWPPLRFTEPSTIPAPTIRERDPRRRTWVPTIGVGIPGKCDVDTSHANTPRQARVMMNRSTSILQHHTTVRKKDASALAEGQWAHTGRQLVGKPVNVVYRAHATGRWEPHDVVCQCLSCKTRKL